MTATNLKEKEINSLLDSDKNFLKEYVKRLFETNNNMYLTDFYVFGLIKRTWGNMRAIKLLVLEKNMNGTRSLLRIHLDSLLRFSALWLVSDIHEFTHNVLIGESLNKLKSKDGKQLTDNYLANELSKNYPWIINVYKNLCSYIHFSSSHIWDGIDPRSLVDNKFTFSFTDEDEKYPEWSWFEILECMHEINIIIQLYLESYLLSRKEFS